MEQVTDLTIDTEERLKGVIDLVFEKAIDEPNFSVAYGNMCRCLATVSRRSSHPSGWTKCVDLRRDKKYLCVLQAVNDLTLLLFRDGAMN